MLIDIIISTTISYTCMTIIFYTDFIHQSLRFRNDTILSFWKDSEHGSHDSPVSMKSMQQLCCTKRANETKIWPKKSIKKVSKSTKILLKVILHAYLIASYL